MRKQTKRKRIYAKASPLHYVIEGVRYTPEHLLDDLRIRELGAIEAFRTGSAALQEWSDVNSMLTLCETMAAGGVGPEALQACERAEKTLIQAAKAFEANGKMTVTANRIKSLRDLYDYHDLQRQSVSRGEYEKWIQRAMDRVRSKAPGVVDISEMA